MKDRFLVGAELGAKIRSILAENGACAAVAFWGRGSEKWVTGKGVRVIANLRMGGTNPDALENVPAKIRQCDRLHAKVYIGARRAVIASPNASINGLALEGLEQRSWTEAGMLVHDVDKIRGWFDKMWRRGSRAITPDDWREAKRLWKLRMISFPPPLASFADFDPTAKRLPVLTWIGSDKWTVNPAALEAAIGSSDAAASLRVQRGIQVAHGNDDTALKDRWVLCWRQLSSTLPSKRKPWFIRLSNIIVRGGFCYTGDPTPHDVVLAAERPSPQPFDPGDDRFYSAFSQVLGRDEFVRLRDEEDDELGWFHSREPLLPSFWAAVKTAHDRAP